MSVGFWLFVIVAIITGVILYNVHPSEQTVFSFVAVGGGAAMGWFVGGILSFIVSLFTVTEKIGNKVNKWLDE